MFLSKNISRFVRINITNNARTVAGIRRLSTVDNEKCKGNYDVIIAGGGMVGCTLACAMAKDSLLSNLKVLLLESGPETKFNLKPEYSNRVVALNQSTKSLMNSLHIWQHVENMRLQPVRYMQVWDACSDALISFSSAEMLNDDVAYIVENDVLLHAINTELSAKSNNNLNINYGSKISGYTLQQGEDPNQKTVVKMSNGDSYTCELLIGADGANSAVRKAMGVQYLAWNYDQMGVVATLYLAEECENTTAWQRMLPTGPVALLPLDSKRSSLVWSTWKDNAKQLLELPEEQFVDALNDALWKEYPRNNAVETASSWISSTLRRVGVPDGATRQLPPSVRSIVTSSRAAFPLGFGHSTKYIAPGVALIGDAAHRVHPLAGQGVNLGFGDIKDLTDLLSNAIFAGLDINHSSWLQQYETSRQRHNVPTQMAIEAIHRLYTIDLPPVVILRSLGLQLTNAIHPIKVPNTEVKWKENAREWNELWNFPHCIGAIDGRHVLIDTPGEKNNRDYFNYKNQFSILLLAIVDASYNVIYANCAKGKSDGAIFQESSFYQSMIENQLNLPDTEPILQRGPELPYVIVGDNFPLSENMMIPYSGINERATKIRIFNYRLRRASRIAENVFGIICVVFRILRKVIPLLPRNCELIVLACVHLHNFLRRNPESRALYTPPETFDFEDSEHNVVKGSWRRECQELSKLTLGRNSNNLPLSARIIRDSFSDYFMSDEGSVPWQINVT